MTTRREVLQLGALGAAGLAGTQVPRDGSSGGGAGQLAPANTPVPYRGVFRRPPELLPYATAFDDGDPNRPFDHFALTQRLGRPQILPGLTTTVAGYNGIFPGPTIRAKQGTRIEVRIRNGFPRRPGCSCRSASTPPPTCTARRRCPSTTGTPTTSRSRASSRTTTIPTGRRRAPSGTTTTGTSSPPRTCTRGWRASTRCPTRSSGRSCRRASSTCR